ncbi:MAG TPA: hypothetical protein VIW03_14470, partial [Anaeromyxobacter sp.]
MHALACLSVLLAAPTVDVPLGDEPLPIEIGLEVRTTGDGLSSPPLAWRTRSDGALEARARGPAYEADVALVPAPGGARRLEVGIRWTAPVALERAALRLGWRGAAPLAVGRELSFVPLAAPRRTGRGTPLLAAAGRAVLAGGPGVVSARIDPVHGGIAVTLFLDDAEERPFSTYEACLERLPSESQGVNWGGLEVRRAVRGSSRMPGDLDALGATLYPLAPAARFLPVVVERWPAGARAAIVLTDHADRTDAAALRAVLWGSSDPRAAGGVGAGLLGRGLKITRTFFAHASAGALDDPEIRLLADDLALSGSEVALHSITPDRDGRDAVRAGLASAAAWRPVTWIDHEPYTNCEAIASRGAGDGPWGIRDLLESAGVRWVWAAGDVDGRAGTRIVNVLGGDPAEARPAIFPLPNDPRLWVFRSSMFYASPAELAAALSDAALAALEAQRGLFVAHTYLGPSAVTTHAESHRARLAVVGTGRALAIHPALDAAFARIAARGRAGRLASLAWSEAGDRLRALGDLEVSYRPDGSAEVRNGGAAEIRALTVTLPAAGLEVSAEGAALLGREDAGGWARLWFDLAAGERVVLRVSDGLVPVPI